MYEIVPNCVTSFMDDPIHKINYYGIKLLRYYVSKINRSKYSGLKVKIICVRQKLKLDLVLRILTLIIIT